MTDREFLKFSELQLIRTVTNVTATNDGELCADSDQSWWRWCVTAQTGGYTTHGGSQPVPLPQKELKL